MDLFIHVCPKANASCRQTPLTITAREFYSDTTNIPSSAMLAFLILLGAAYGFVDRFGFDRPLVCANSPLLSLVAGQSSVSARYVGRGVFYF